VPDFYSAHLLLGNVYRKESRYTDAEKQYKTAHELNGRAAQPLVSIGGMFIQEAEAITNPNDAQRGNILDDALDALDEATKLDSQSAIAFYLLGVAYYRSAFFDESEKNLTRSFQLDSHSGSTRLMLVNVYMKKEKWQLALDQVNAYLAE